MRAQPFCLLLLYLSANSFLIYDQRLMKSEIAKSPFLSSRSSTILPIQTPCIPSYPCTTQNRYSSENNVGVTDFGQIQNFSLSDFYWNQYYEAMSIIMIETRVVKKSSDVEPVQHFLLDRSWPKHVVQILDAQNYLQEQERGIDVNQNISTHFRSQMNSRLEAFLHTWNFTKQQKAYMDRCFTYLGDRCAAMQVSSPLVIGWLKWRLTGSIPRENSLSTYMYSMGLTNSSHDLISTQCLWDIVAMHDLLFPPSEKTTTLRIQALIAQGKHKEAEHLVFSLSLSSDNATDVSRLRTFAPILSYYCNEAGDLASALRLFERMRQSQGVYLDAATYAMLLSSLAARGYFSPRTEIESQLGLKGGSKLLDQLLTHMSSDLLELTEDAVYTLYQGFLAANNQTKDELTNKTSPIPTYTTAGRISFGRVWINDTTGVCEATGVKLRSLTLDVQQRQHLRETLLGMAYSSQEEFRASTNVAINSTKLPTGEYCRNELQNFSNWLASRDQPFTAIVDGANVAHFGSGMVQYSQLKLMVDELLRLGEKPLVIMPEKYTLRKFYLRHLGIVQELRQKDIEAINELEEKGLIFFVPKYCFDDYFWMIASVTDQKLCHNNATAHQGKLGKIPGQRPILISNDQMRDHRLALLEPRHFRRWTSCHIVNFAIDGYINDEWEAGRRLKLFPPSVFSREIQSNELPGKAGQKAWHLPVTGWDEPYRFCISIAPEQ